ncbi:MAG: cytochrome b [Pseudomonadota bacterium]
MAAEKGSPGDPGGASKGNARGVSSERYSLVAIAFHWTIAALIIGQIAGGLYMSRIAQGASQFELYQLHKSFGLTVLALSVLRLGWRLITPVPPLPDNMISWQKRVAKFTHIAFYVLMISLPIGGWALVSASPYADSIPTFVFGLFEWPHLPFFEGVEDREGLTKSISRSHLVGGLTMAALFFVHAGAALKHQFIDRDDLLFKMLPFKRK